MSVIGNISNNFGPKHQSPEEYLNKLKQVFLHYQALHEYQTSFEIRAELYEAKKAYQSAIQSINAQSEEDQAPAAAKDDCPAR